MSVQSVVAKTPSYREQKERDLPLQEGASLSEKIFSTSSETTTNLGDRKISPQSKSRGDEKDLDKEPGIFSLIFNNPVAKSIGAAALTVLAAWVAGKAIDSLTEESIKPSSPIEPGAEDTSLSPFMESISMRHGRDKDPVGPQEREPRDPMNREHDNWASEPPYEPGQEKGK